MTLFTRLVSLGVMATLAGSVLLSQSPTAASGHWSGAIEVPGQPIGIEVDLALVSDKWEGAISIPVQKLEAFPLSDVAVIAASVGFAMKGVPGDPTFRGTIGEDGKSIAGDFSQGGGKIPFRMTRTGEAKLEPPAKSTALSKEFVGSWEGTLDAGGQQLRLILRLSNGANGEGGGTLVSVDQGGAEIPITSVTQEGSALAFQVKTVNGSFKGDLQEGGKQIVGNWSQGGGTLPLAFTRSGPANGKK
jgi:hypothetical protein